MVGLLPQTQKSIRRSFIEWVNPNPQKKEKEFDKPKSKFHK